MKTFNSALAAAALAAALPGAAQAHDAQSGPVVGAGNTLLSVSAEGRSTRTPDLAVFSAGVNTQGKTAAEALSANSVSMTAVFSALKKAGVADRDIQTSNLSVNPVYAQPVVRPNGEVVNQEPRIIGYQVYNTVNVKQRDIKGFGKVLDALVASGANQVNGPSFQLDTPDAAMDEARTAAMKAARARADLYARAAGLRVVRILTISEGGGYSQPMPVMYAKAEMAAPPPAPPPPVAAGQVDMQVNVSVQFELAP